MNGDTTELDFGRRFLYALLIIVTLSTVTGRVMSVRSTDGRTPFFSANDRSRWLTIRSLVEDDSYVVDRVRKIRGWQSIDMVRHQGRDGQLHYYSSKPPLFPTILSWKYRLIRAVTGADFEHFPFGVARTILFTTNVLPFAVFLLLITVWAERECETDFGRLFVVASACWGTYLTPFVSSLNNHLPAAIGVLICALCLWRIWDAGREPKEPDTDSESKDAPGWLFAVAGLASGFTAANELPALSFAALFSMTLLWLQPRKTLLWYVPAISLVAVAFFATTYAAHESWRPPYAHRQSGDNWYDYPGSYWYGKRTGVDLGEPSRAVYSFHTLFGHHGFFSLTPIWLLSLMGAAQWLIRGSIQRRYIAALTLGLFVICVAYYCGIRPQRDRNYGGVTSGFRWLFWQIPLWLMLLAPASDWLAERRWRRALALALLAASVFSASVAARNPWTHPWIYQGLEALGWA